jgi:membrane-associated protease RseP (regulator of RpoE activity)
MKASNITLFISTALLLAGMAFGAESDNTQPYLGVLLDMAPLPELLTKHLGLPPGLGVRIRNIQNNSPAEEAGLERDDIIIRIGDKDIYKYESIVLMVQEAQVGEEITLEVIHLGKHKNIKVKLAAVKGEPDWKYPTEPEIPEIPEIEESIHPGRIFTWDTQKQKWIEILTDDLPQGLDFTKLFKEQYKFTNPDGGSITIEGNPNHEDSKIIIQDGDARFETSAKEIDKLPEKYRDAAQKALKKAQERKSDGSFTNPSEPSLDFEKLFPQPNTNINPPGPLFEQDNRMLDKMTEQMSQLLERIKELEKSQSELLDRLNEKKES